MLTIRDYMIIQRDGDGMGHAKFEGTYRSNDCNLVVSRVMREDDNLTVIPWRKCTTEGDKWSIDLDIPEGGLYRVEARQVKGDFTPYSNGYDWAELCGIAFHVGVGEVYVVAGQSNMSAFAKDFAYDPPQLGVHCLDNRGEWVIATNPLNSSVNGKYFNNDVSSGCSPALSFARTMYRRLGVPIGLVACAHGGAPLYQYDPDHEDNVYYPPMKEKIGLAGAIGGILWYQGCSDCGCDEDANTYLDRFTRIVREWREEFGDVPVVNVQLNRHAYRVTNDNRYWGIVRDAQRRAENVIHDLYTVPTIDLYTNDGIHNASGPCVILGERMANALLRGHYHLAGRLAPNVRKIIQVDKDKIKLKFDRDCAMVTMDNLAHGLNIEDEQGMMACTSVASDGLDIIVTGEREIVGEAVFHAYWEKEEPAFFVRDIYGMPMLACYGVKIEK